MTTYAIIAGAISATVALAMFLLRRYEASAKQIGRDEIVKQVQHEDIEATRRADTVLAERRDPAATAGRLSDGSF